MIDFLFFLILATSLASVALGLVVLGVSWIRAGTRPVWTFTLSVVAVGTLAIFLLLTLQIPPNDDPFFAARMGEVVRPHLDASFGAAVGGLAAFALVLAGVYLTRIGRNRLAVVVPSVLLLLLMSASSYALAERDSPRVPRELDVIQLDAIQSSLPDGLTASAATPEHLFPGAFAFTWGDDGALYVAFAEGIARALYDADRGTVEVGSAFSDTSGLGLTWYRDGLLVSSYGSLLHVVDRNNDGRADEERVLAEDLPSFVYDGHSTNGVIVDGEGNILLLVGGTSDHGPEDNLLAGSALSVTEDGDVQVYAAGFRNPFDVTACPDGRMFVTDNGPDQLGSTLVFHPPDEVNELVAGQDYGYPSYFGWAPPSSGTMSPFAILPMSGAATGITCYSVGALGSEFELGLFVTLWGTLVLPEENGRRLMWVDLNQNEPRTGVEFAAGFVRPIDVLVTPDGALLILDQAAGQIIRIGRDD